MDGGWLRVLRRRVAPDAFFSAADVSSGRALPPSAPVAFVLDAAVEPTIERLLCGFSESGGGAAAAVGAADVHAALGRRLAACAARWPATLAAYVCIFDDARHVPLARLAAPPARRAVYPPAADRALPGVAGHPIQPYADGDADADADGGDPWRACATPRVRRRRAAEAAAFLANECRAADGAPRAFALVVDGGLVGDGGAPEAPSAAATADAVFARAVGGGAPRLAERVVVPLARPPAGEAALKAARWAADLAAGRLRGAFGEPPAADAITLVRAPLEALAPLLLAVPALVDAAGPPRLFLEVCECEPPGAAADAEDAASMDTDEGAVERGRGDEGEEGAAVLVDVGRLWRALVDGSALPSWLPLPVEHTAWLLALGGGDGAFVEATPRVGPRELWSALVDEVEWRAPTDGSGGYVAERGPPYFGALLLARNALLVDEELRAHTGGACIVRSCELPQMRFLAYVLQRLHAEHVVQPGWPPDHVANLAVLRHEIARAHEDADAAGWAVPKSDELAARCRRATWCVNYWATAYRDGFGGADRSCDVDAASGLAHWGWARDPASGAVVRTENVWNALIYG